MEHVIRDIARALCENGGRPLDNKELTRLLNVHNKRVGGATKAFSKKNLMPFCLRMQADNPDGWATLFAEASAKASAETNPLHAGNGAARATRSTSAQAPSPEQLERALLDTLKVKPRRTASGVATITVITKPWTCSSNCRYCPNDIRMPKSYLADEPACQRAERNCFDPYLQVTRRLRTLHQMGHTTSKVELIVLGGTWSDYPESYQLWFVTELFRALNDGVGDTALQREKTLRQQYEQAGILYDREALIAQCEELQQSVNAGNATYNQAASKLYGIGERATATTAASAWRAASAWQQATLSELVAAQKENEAAEHRMVGLVVETRPDLITPESLTLLRRLGCTKVQMGIQSLDPDILRANQRRISTAKIAEALELARLFGFKTHTHFMVNLLGATPESDEAEYRRFMTEPEFQPDEVKLYPCALIGGTALESDYACGRWTPYTENELLDVLVKDTLATPSFCRISRMIRDFSAGDIVAGNKKINLRQLVEQRLEQTGAPVQEIRYREIATSQIDAEKLRLDAVPYETAATHEVFLQWVTPENRIAGFLRLSLPKQERLQAWAKQGAALPITAGEAMIREVHVYGKAAQFHASSRSAQHTGLGKQLVERAAQIARDEGFDKLNVISAVGTRGYYRSLGFVDNGLYQQLDLSSKA